MRPSPESEGSVATRPPVAFDLGAILRPSQVVCGARPSSKKLLLEQLATLLTQDEENLCPHNALDLMAARERIGSTGLGRGVALPHARLDGCQRIVGAFMHLALPLEYDAPDQQPVDLVFALLLPPGEDPQYAEALAAIATHLHSPGLCRELRNTALYRPEAVYDLLIRPPA